MGLSMRLVAIATPCEFTSVIMRLGLGPPTSCGRPSCHNTGVLTILSFTLEWAEPATKRPVGSIVPARLEDMPSGSGRRCSSHEVGSAGPAGVALGDAATLSRLPPLNVLKAVGTAATAS